MQLSKGAGGYDEAWLRNLIFEHCTSIPVEEIDPSFGPLVPVCRELYLRTAGPSDAFFINALGMPTLVECKLWRNPEARREVVGQILDYARVLRTWTYTDLQREAARALNVQGFDLFEHVRNAGHPELEEAVFVDNVTRNLGSGRVMLLVLGDGIREGVEAIADYIQGSTGLHFTFGLVDTRIFDAGEGRLVVQPRVLAKTIIFNRTVVTLSGQGLSLDDESDQPGEADRARATRDPATVEWTTKFWEDVLRDLELDDAEQRLPPPRAENPLVKMASGNVWLRCTLSRLRNEVGIYLDGMVARSDLAVEILRRLNEDRDAILEEIGLPAETLTLDKIGGKLSVGNLNDEADRALAVEWLRSAINDFVNAIRPRVMQIFAELKGD